MDSAAATEAVDEIGFCQVQWSLGDTMRRWSFSSSVNLEEIRGFIRNWSLLNPGLKIGVGPSEDSEALVYLLSMDTR